MENVTFVQAIEIIKVIIYIGSLLLAVYKMPNKLMTLFKQTIKEELSEVSKKIDENEKDHLRFEILSFAGDLRNGISKTRQEFETVFAFHDKYEKIIEKLKEHNGYLDSEFDYIKEKYRRL